MTRKIPKTYCPKEVEDKIYQLWQKSGYFNPDNLPLPKNAKPFCIAMPLPNVTGELHLGHAVTMTIEDLLIRFKRMQGYKTLWIPGTDHAGIATQVMVEKELAKEGKTRWDLGKEEFLKRVWDFKEKTEKKILSQIKKMGSSCDWSRYHFTLDRDLTEAVNEAFIKLYQDDLIYKGEKIINWCPRCQTVLSDLEVEHKEEKGKLWYIKYKIKNQKLKIKNTNQNSKINYITVVTTRPETMLGDTAVAVNPKDKRYKKLVGKKVVLPIIKREIPIIQDFRVDPEFGTGAVKITPAHDPTDWEIGQTYKLKAIQVIGQDGKMTKKTGEFAGLSTFEAREKIVKRLQQEDLLEKIEDYVHSVGHCYRCGRTIEHLVSKQWFVKIKPLAEKAIEAVKQGKIKIIPKRFEKIYFEWMRNIKDWCISRQIWWGHQLPVYYCKQGEIKNKKAKTKNFGCGRCIVAKEKPKKCPTCGNKNLIQDQDVLDTWFSSSLWTFSTLKWPASAKATAGKLKKTKDLKFFHPTSVMETGWDILFFWVARMIMMSLYLLKEIPFKTVYLHGLVLDPKTGEKMSKTKGTGLDPLTLIEKYGADALRLSLVLGTTAGQDFKLYEEKIAGYRNFANKLWNIARYILIKNQRLTPSRTSEFTLADRWILSRLHRLIESVTLDLENFRLGKAGEDLYKFVWHEFADWYLEISKIQKENFAFYVLGSLLKLLHPFIPFITEEIWQKIVQKPSLLIIQPWPKFIKRFINLQAEKQFKLIQNIIVKLRNAKAQQKIKPNQLIKAYLVTRTKKEFYEKQKEIVERLAKVKLEIKTKKPKVKKLVSFRLNQIEIILEV